MRQSLVCIRGEVAVIVSAERADNFPALFVEVGRHAYGPVRTVTELGIHQRLLTIVHALALPTRLVAIVRTLTTVLGSPRNALRFRWGRVRTSHLADVRSKPDRALHGVTSVCSLVTGRCAAHYKHDHTIYPFNGC